MLCRSSIPGFYRECAVVDIHTIVKERFHLGLDGAEHDQATGRVPILEAIHQCLQQRGQTGQPSVDGKSEIRAAPRRLPPRTAYPRQPPPLAGRGSGKRRDGVAGPLPEPLSGIESSSTRPPSGSSSAKVVSTLLDEGRLADSAASTNGAEERAPLAHPLQQSAKLFRASVEVPACAHGDKITIPQPQDLERAAHAARKVSHLPVRGCWGWIAHE